MPNHKFNSKRKKNRLGDIKNAAYGLFYQENYSNAKIAFLKGLRKYPYDNDLAIGLARCYQNLDNFSEAESIFKFKLDVDKNYEPTYRAYVFFLEKQGRYDCARLILEACINQFPTYAKAYKMLIFSYLNANLHDKALEVIEKAIFNFPNIAKYTHMKAQHFENIGDFDNAIETLKSAKIKFNRDLNIYLSLAFCYEKKGQYENAINQYNETILLFPTNDSPKRALKNLYTKMKLIEPAKALFTSLNETYDNKISYAKFLIANRCFDKAISELDILISNEPTLMDAYMAKARIYVELKRYDEALAIYHYLSQNFPENCNKIDLKKGHLELHRQNFEKAAEYFERLTSIPEIGLDALEGKANVLREKGELTSALQIVATLKEKYYFGNSQYKLKIINRLSAQINLSLKCYHEAIADCEYNLSYLQGDSVDQLCLAKTYLEKGDLSISLEITQKLMSQYPHYQEAKLHYAYILESLCDYNGAEIAFKNVIDEFPQYKEARLSYGRCLSTAGKLDEALKELMTLRQMFPEYKEADLAYARCLSEMGNLVDALKEINQVCEKYPGYRNARLTKVRFLSDMGQLDEALNIVDQIRKMYPKFEDAHITRARIFEDMGNLNAARVAFWNTCTIFPHSTVALLGYIRVLVSMRDNECLCECYSYLTSNNLLSKEIKLAYACYYGSTKQYSKADTMFNSLLKDYPNYQDAFLRYAKYLQKAKRHQAAINEFEHICELFPDNPKVFLGRAKFWETMTDKVQTLKAYEELKKRFPQYKKGLLQFALYMTTLSDKAQEADLQFNEIIKNFPMYSEAKAKYVLLKSWSKTCNSTELKYLNLLAKYPYNQNLHLQHIDFLCFQGQYDNAIEKIKRYKEKFKYNQFLYRKHILILIDDDAKRLAIRQFNHASRMFPFNRKISKLKEKIDFLKSTTGSNIIMEENKIHGKDILHQFSKYSDHRKRKPENEITSEPKKFKIHYI